MLLRRGELGLSDMQLRRPVQIDQQVTNQQAVAQQLGTFSVFTMRGSSSSGNAVTTPRGMVSELLAPCLCSRCAAPDKIPQR